MFFKKYTKWKPITVFTHDFQDFLILGRINKKTGMPYFTSVKIGHKNKYQQGCHLFNNPFNATKNLKELLNI